MTPVEHLVATYHERLGRLANAGGPRSERITVCVTPRTFRQLTEMAEHWQMVRSHAASELLAVAAEEAWAAFEQAKEGMG